MSDSQLSEIPIRIEWEKSQQALQYPNVQSLLVEIQHGLEQFYQNGHQRIVDLGSIPMPAFERNKLLQLLGKGEVEVNLSSLGKSEIYETLLSGVWVVKHYDEEEKVSAMFIEVTRIPDIVRSQMDDLESLTDQVQEMIAQVKN